MTRREATMLIRSGRIVSLVFIKRTTGETRNMVCRTGVKKYLKGGTKSFNDEDYNLITVWDFKVKGYRTVPVDGLQQVKVKGIWEVVEDGK